MKCVRKKTAITSETSDEQFDKPSMSCERWNAENNGGVEK